MNFDSSDPETIEPLQEDVGNFLDFDISNYEKKANDAYRAGNYEKAAKYYIAFLRYNIKDVSSIYNLACCYGLLGEDELAVKNLKRAIRAGYKDIEHIKNDPDFDSVRESKLFRKFIDSISLEIKEEEDELGELIYIENSALFKCRIQLPEDYNNDKSYPLVLGLHGGGSSPDKFITLWKDFREPKFIYAATQAPYPYLSGNEIVYEWALWPTKDMEIMEKAKETLDKYIAEIVSDLEKRYNIKDVYLMGHSQGAIFTYTAGINNHHLFKGLIILSGPGLFKPIYSPFMGLVYNYWKLEESIKAANDLRIFIAHSREDQVVKYELGLASKEVLTNYGYDVTFFDFEGGHIITPDVLE
jgi:predicted esterase